MTTSKITERPDAATNRDDDIRERPRGIEDKLFLTIEILAPDEADGPPLDEVLVRLVMLIAE